MAKTTNHPPYKVDPWEITPEKIDSSFIGTITPGEIKAEVSAPETDFRNTPEERPSSLQKVYDSIEKTDDLIAQQKVLSEQAQKAIDDSKSANDIANQALAQSGNTEAALAAQAEEYLAKIQALEAANQQITTKQTELTTSTSNALTEAQKANKALADYKTTTDSKISTLTTTANKGVSDAAAASKALSDYKTSMVTTINDLTAKADKGINDAKAANDGLATLNSQFSTKVEDQIKVSATMKAISDSAASAISKADAASSKAQQGVDDAKIANDGLAALNTNFGTKVEDQIKISGTLAPIKQTAQTAASDAAKAVDWLKNPVEIGASLITMDPETKKPDYLLWAGNNLSGSSLSLPENFTGGVYISGASVEVTKNASPRKFVKVSPSITYKWKLKVRSYGESAGPIQIVFVNQAGSSSPLRNTKMNASDAFDFQSSYWGIILTPKLSNSNWYEISGTMEFSSDTESVAIRSFLWNRSRPSTAPGTITQAIADLDIVPEIPTQAQVDDAQNKAIASHNILFDAQTGWNKTQEKINENQRLINDKQTQINDLVTKTNSVQDQAIAANTEALKFQNWLNDKQSAWNLAQEEINRVSTAMWDSQKGINAVNNSVNKAQNDAIRALARINSSSSIVPYIDLTDADIQAGITTPYTPVWANNLSYKEETQEEFKRSYRSPGTSETSTYAPGGYWVNIDKGVRYKASVWVYTNEDTTAALLFEMQGRDGAGALVTGHPIVSGSFVVKSDSTKIPMFWKNGWLFGIKNKKAGWQKLEVTFQFKPEVEAVRFQRIWWNYNSGTTGYGAASWLVADLELSPDVPTQAQVDASQNKAIAANTRAIETINTGASLIPYAEPTDNEILAGTAKWDVPVWAAPSSVVRSTETVGANANTTIWSCSAKTAPIIAKQLVSIDPTNLYKLSFYSKAGAAGTQIVFLMKDESENPAPSKVREITGKDSNGSRVLGNALTNGWLANHSPGTTWKKYEYLVEFREGVERVYLSQVCWNNSTAANTKQSLAMVRLEPDIPTQADVDSAQNKAIESLNQFQQQQLLIEANQKDIDKTQDDLIKLAFPDLDLTPKNGIDPYWATGLTYKTQAPLIADGETTRAYLFPSTATSAESTVDGAYFVPIEGVNLRVQVAIFNDVASGSSSGGYSFWLKTESGTDAIQSVKSLGYRWRNPDEPYHQNEIAWQTDVKAIASGTGGRWTVHNWAVKLIPNAGKVRIRIQTNTGGINWIGVKITTYSDYQYQIDYNQNKAIESNRLFAEEQQKINEKQREIDIEQDTMSGQLIQVTTDLDTRMVGKVFMPRDSWVLSEVHKIGAVMPGTNRELGLYARKDFNGSILVMVVYSNKTVKMYNVESWQLRERTEYDFNTLTSKAPESNLRSLNSPLGAKATWLTVEVGDVENITLFIDQAQWVRGYK